MIFDNTAPNTPLNDWSEARKYEDLPDRIPTPDQIFVFGSNLPGLHGKGAAKFAVQRFGAIYGHGEGPQGQAYAIPTKQRWNKTMPLKNIKVHVSKFIEYARANPDKSFFVTKIGCGLAGYTEEMIAPMFADAPINCDLPWGWRDYNFNLKEI